MIRLRTFGSVELESPRGEDVRAVLAQPKRLALLIYLAAARPFRAHRRDDLLALFWPDLDDARARDALNQALRFLRQALGAEAFIRRGAEDVGLDRERVWSDAAAFQEALDAGRPAQALELYRGPFLQGFFIEEGGGFEEWMDRERTALREAAARGARQLADESADAGALTLAVDWGRKALELVPDDERALRRLLRWYDRAGDRAGAFRQYEAFSRRFEEQFGSKPSPETQALLDQLRAGKALSPERGATPGGAASTPPGATASQPTLMPEQYRIERKLGEGGMATVYLARDLKHDRDVALKVLKPRIAQSLARERFIREIRIAGRLQHPNIVPLFDSGEMDGQLFYVMPHVRGQTLRDRIRREGTLDLEMVRHVLREVAGALAYAHDQGVVHRDIKPENILLIDRRALLTDFGIARAAQIAETSAEAFDATLTQPGTGLGTPAYMAPEQAAGKDALDHRADLYALGAVGYEMLTGRPPFSGSSPQELLAAQLTRTPEPIESLRPDVPRGLASLVLACLEKEAASRPATAQRVLAALESGAPGIAAVGPAQRPVARRAARIFGGAALAGALLLAGREVALRGGVAATNAGLEVDTSRYAILPFARGADVPVNLPVEQLMQDALARWEGIRIVDRFLVNDAFALAGRDRSSGEASARIATSLDAGRFLRGEVTTIGDSLRIYVSLYEAVGKGRQIVDRSVRVSRSFQSVDSVFFHLVDALLLSGHRGGGANLSGATRSLPARQAFSGAYGAIEEWQLARADSLFFRATQLDPGFTEAFLWLAQVRMWRRLPDDQWSFAAERAVQGRSRLAARDQVLADALLSMAAGNLPSACATLQRLAGQESHDFAAWYGMGTCLARDSLVVPDPASPSRWAFRSSYAQALKGYTRAFELLSSIRRSLKASAYEPVRRLLKTSSINTRLGYSRERPPRLFQAYPSMDGDTLGFAPYPAAEFQRGTPRIVPGSVGRAVAGQRQLFHRLASGWVAQNPQSSDALEALAIATQMLGDPAALDTLARARARALTPEDSLRLAGADVWMRLKFSAPDDPAGLAEVRRMADSLLGLGPEVRARQPALFVSLAVLRGRANLAARLTRDPQVAADWGIPPAIGQATAALMVFSALGGPRDRLGELWLRTRRLVAGLADPASRDEVVARFLARSATLAGPEAGRVILDSLAADSDYLWSAQQAFRRGDWAAVRGSLARLRGVRRPFPPEDLAFDAVYPEAVLLSGMGDTALAAQWLDQVLQVLPRTPPQVSPEPALIGPLVRAMALRAQLAAQLGDRSAAARWATAVEILWSGADPFLGATLDSMRILTRATAGTTH